MLHFSTFESNQRLIPFDETSAILQENNTKNNDKHPLIAKLETFVNANLHNEQFGVEQLAEMMGMSRSHLHRKLHKVKGKSISRFIREYRLEAARKMLIEKEMTASEVSHAVGFGSPSYFNKCFTEYFGYSPGKTRLKVGQEITRNTVSKSSKSKMFLWLSGLAAAILVGFLIFFQNKKEVVVAETIPEEKSIFVMPIDNLSTDENNNYLAFGMRDALHRHLGNLEGINLISPLAFDPRLERTELVNTIGKEKRNAVLLVGSLQRAENSLRMEFSLINPKTKQQVWAEKYDREVEDILSIQNELAQNVAHKLQVVISKEDKSQLIRETSYDPKAYELYLQGWYQYNSLSRKSNERALYYLTEAIKKDSTLPMAYMGLATYYAGEASVSVSNLEASEAISLSRENLNKAVALDPNVQYADTNLAFTTCFMDWDFEKAEYHYLRAINGNEPLAYFLYRDLLVYENRHSEALVVAEKLNSEFPYYIGACLAVPYYYNGKIEEGKKYVKRYLKKNPTDHMGLDNIGFFYLNTGEYEKALEIFQKVMDNGDFRFPRMLGWMGAGYAKKGESVKANELISELKEMKKISNAGAPAFFIAIIHSALGEKQEALKWLKTSIDDHEMEVPWLVSEPQLYPLHGMPEFDALAKRVGFREHAYPIELPTHFQ